MSPAVQWVARWICLTTVPRADVPTTAITIPISWAADELGRVPESLPTNVGGDFVGTVSYAVRVGDDRIAYVPRSE